MDVTLWARQAEVASQYLKKGRPVFVEGRLHLDRWENSDGQKRSKLKIVGQNFQFLGGSGGKEPTADVVESVGEQELTIDEDNIPYFVCEFEENMTSFDHLEIQLETFVENLLFD